MIHQRNWTTINNKQRTAKAASHINFDKPIFIVNWGRIKIFLIFYDVWSTCSFSSSSSLFSGIISRIKFNYIIDQSYCTALQKYLCEEFEQYIFPKMYFRHMWTVCTFRHPYCIQTFKLYSNPEQTPYRNLFIFVNYCFIFVTRNFIERKQTCNYSRLDYCL